MRQSVWSLLQCGAISGGSVRARAVCVHAALKLAANLLQLYEARNDKDAAIAVRTVFTTSLKFNLTMLLSDLFE